MLLSDVEGAQLWGVMFDYAATKVLDFDANWYRALKSDSVRYSALSILRGSRVMTTIKKRQSGEYVKNTVEVIVPPHLSFFLTNEQR